MNPFSHACSRWKRWLHLVLVIDRHVIDDVLPALIHSRDPAANKCRHLIRKGRIVRNHMRHCMSDQVRVSIVMLQSFASKGGAPRGRTDQEATYARIATLPDLVAYSLEAKH